MVSIPLRRKPPRGLTASFQKSQYFEPENLNSWLLAPDSFVSKLQFSLHGRGLTPSIHDFTINVMLQRFVAIPQLQLKLKSCSQQANKNSIVTTVIFRINNNVKAGVEENTIINSVTIKSLNLPSTVRI